MSDYLDDLLDDYGIDSSDLSDYGLDSSDLDYLDDYIDDYYPTGTDTSSSLPTSGSSSDDYYGYDDLFNGSDSNDDSSSGSYDFGGSSSFGDSDTPISGDLPPGYGSIGSDYSFSSTSDSCVTDAAFQTTGPRVDLAFDVIFLVLFLLIGGLAVFRLLRSKSKGAALGRWFLFPVSLFFAILYLLIDFITLILNQCIMMRSDKYQLAQIAVTWFDNLSVFLLIVLILLPICLKLQQGGGKIASITLIVHSVWLGLTGIFLIVSLATFTRIQDAIYRSGDSIDSDLPEASRDVTMTYYVFLFLAALLGGANLFFALFRRANIRKGSLLLAIPTLIISTLGLTLVLMGGYADLSYGNRTRSASSYEKSQDAQVFLKRFFYLLAFISALMIAGSHQAGDDSATTTQQPVVAPPPQPQMAQNQGLPQQPQQQQYYSASPVEGTVHAPVPVPAAYGHA
ncbi:hypothetical protein BJX68DRAFT_265446 [Aspergillus pseudodeflectus]|uniref:Uncharacterized protein n=1 Tax=Aspergillus pseudodeflectus TaxID=176178 RepID=A0ABR4KJW3_9EURO